MATGASCYELDDEAMVAEHGQVRRALTYNDYIT